MKRLLSYEEKIKHGSVEFPVRFRIFLEALYELHEIPKDSVSRVHLWEQVVYRDVRIPGCRAAENRLAFYEHHFLKSIGIKF